MANFRGKFTRHNASMAMLAHDILSNTCPTECNDDTGYRKFEIDLHCNKAVVTCNLVYLDSNNLNWTYENIVVVIGNYT